MRNNDNDKSLLDAIQLGDEHFLHYSLKVHLAHLV